MRRNWIVTIILVLSVGIWARAENNNRASAVPPAPPKEAVKPADSSAAKNVETARTEKREASAVELELQQLRELLLDQAKELEAQREAVRQQQQKLEVLTQELREVRASKEAAASSEKQGSTPVSLGAVSQNQEDLGNKVGKIEQEVSATKKSLETRIKGFGPFNFSGDLRLRYENAFGGRATNVPAGVAQHRERFRLRLNATAKFNDEVSGGFSIASGALNNPLSTNQTFDTFYTRKTIGIDKAFMTYNPKWLQSLSLTAGKFNYTWYRTELAWDNDLNPEGISESVHWNWKDSFLQHLGIVAFQLPYNESFSGGGATTPTPSGATFGGQLQANVKLQDRFKVGAYVAYYDYRNADQIAQNQVGGSGPTTGALGGNNNTNFVGTIGGARFFASKFGVVDSILRLDANTGIGRLPMMLLFNYAQNTRACGNVGTFASANPPVTVFCDPKQRHAYWSEVQFGRTQEKGDVRLGYTFMRIERDAVPSAFNFDDKRQATNVAQHRAEIFYQAYKNITLGFTGLIGRQLVTATSPTTAVTPERMLKRFQFDLIYKF